VDIIVLCFLVKVLCLSRLWFDDRVRRVTTGRRAGNPFLLAIASEDENAGFVYAFIFGLMIRT
jgi:hypothetical protein